MYKPTVFLSHVKEDKNTIQNLQSYLELYGVTVQTSYNSIRGGKNWRSEIKNCIQNKVDYVILCFSESYTIRRQTIMNEEIHYAIETQRKKQFGSTFIIPIRFNKCKIPDNEITWTENLSEKQYIDLFSDPSSDSDWYIGIQKILEAMKINLDQTLIPTRDPLKEIEIFESLGFQMGSYSSNEKFIRVGTISEFWSISDYLYTSPGELPNTLTAVIQGDQKTKISEMRIKLSIFNHRFLQKSYNLFEEKYNKLYSKIYQQEISSSTLKKIRELYLKENSEQFNEFINVNRENIFKQNSVSLIIEKDISVNSALDPLPFHLYFRILPHDTIY